MVDIVDAKTRSDMMSMIRGSGNRSTELAFIGILRRAKFTGWRRHEAFRLELMLPTPSGEGTVLRQTIVRPDFTFRKQRLVVFVDGCFWHQCPIHASIPKQNKEFWKAKLALNVARDKATVSALLKRGWRVMRVWEHELGDAYAITKKLSRRLTYTPSMGR